MPDLTASALLVAISGILVFLARMQIIPSSMLPERDEGALRQFLVGCREAARAKRHYQIASISLAVKHIAPLAVLQSIYEPDELHCYIERASDDEAVAAAEAVVQARFDGSDRFASVKAFAEEILENTIAVGDLSEAFTGPHFFTAFTFDDTVSESAPFPAATVFLPRWQVSRSKGQYGAVANLKVEADTDIDSLVMRVWGAYRKFGAFDYLPEAALEDAAPSPKIESRRELAPDVYPQAVARALSAIELGAYEKIVLARGIELEADRPWQPLDTLNRLRERFAGCFTFSFAGGDARSFIGATPERLLQVRNGHLLTEAIAGSAPRGQTAGEDAKYARDLLESEKDLHEHICVRDSIIRRLEQVGVGGVAESHPQLLLLANVQHLRTRIQAEVGESVHLLDILPEMHPTPAVGGSPREQAVPCIAELEQMERGLYAGVVGWFNHLNEGEMIVGIRSALIEGKLARLYAGAGIVRGSKPDTEMRETEMKLRALLDVLA
ncbi:isochorismate synthase [Coraliomargarita sp. SDUM461004]|uniref:isochorismate synthase n=1 Tax=Thalassobacterium sedimentorum TaxID=3041258 RepID=A0ABU1AJ99_9BACT|nr:isochorismate synthase [Coraliomargarita sp. SDUM461004]MDQ8194897.1 isochorismate synthase [Coraliomargarita sp. SDUM461004]